MKRPFREHHLLEIFNTFESDKGPHRCPLDLFLRNYFRAHKSVGAKDRKAIADAIYGIMRWRGLLDHLIQKPISWEKRYALFQEFVPEKHISDLTIPLHVRLSFPKKFFHLLQESLGEEQFVSFCLASNEPAPTTVRVNTLKTTRDALLNTWQKTYDVSPCTHAQTGIQFHKKINFFALPEFKMGLFEVQDEASQLIAELVKVVPGQRGQRVLDFCAGSGGKALAIAPHMQHKGQLYLHDIRSTVLQEAKKRLRRAGVQNAQVLPCDAPHKKALRHAMDWVLVDAPCSGTGTLRRNPDMKWKFSEESLKELVDLQRNIFKEALAFVRPGGSIVYATCSVLPMENAAQAEFFETTYNLKRQGAPFSSFPTKDSMDGFFGVVFKTSST